MISRDQYYNGIEKVKEVTQPIVVCVLPTLDNVLHYQVNNNI